MIKQLIQYPNIQTVSFDAPVRMVTDEIKTLIEDLKDTIIANDLDGLSAYQINNPYNVIVLKDEQNQLLVLINPSIYSFDDTVITEEQTTYFKKIKASIKRHKHIKVVYEDIDLKTNYLSASDDFAILLQRKIDYTLGGTIRYRLGKKEQENFDMKLEYGDEFIVNSSCPTTYFKDKIKTFTEYLLAFSFISLFLALFLDENNTLILTQIENYSMGLISVLIITYFLYGLYENKKNVACSSCQIGHLLGNSVILFLKLIVLVCLNYIIFLSMN
jgi:peptide deformylase